MLWELVIADIHSPAMQGTVKYVAKDWQAWTSYMCAYGSRVPIGVPAMAVAIPHVVCVLVPTVARLS